MKVNHDKHEVHLSREMYDDLIRLALMGEDQLILKSQYREGSVVSRVKRHARKFNRSLHLERKDEVLEEETRIVIHKHSVQLFVRRHINKEVYFHPYFIATGVDKEVLLKGTVLSRGQTYKDRIMVRCESGSMDHSINWRSFKNKTQEVKLGDILTDLNGEWHETTKGVFVKGPAEGPYVWKTGEPLLR